MLNLIIINIKIVKNIIHKNSHTFVHNMNNVNFAAVLIKMNYKSIIFNYSTYYILLNLIIMHIEIIHSLIYI